MRMTGNKPLELQQKQQQTHSPANANLLVCKTKTLTLSHTRPCRSNHTHQVTQQAFIFLAHKPTLDTKTGVGEIFPHIVLDLFAPHAPLSLFHKASHAHFSCFGAICSNKRYAFRSPGLLALLGKHVGRWSIVVGRLRGSSDPRCSRRGSRGILRVSLRDTDRGGNGAFGTFYFFFRNGGNAS